MASGRKVKWRVAEVASGVRPRLRLTYFSFTSLTIRSLCRYLSELAAQSVVPSQREGGVAGIFLRKINGFGLVRVIHVAKVVERIGVALTCWMKCWLRTRRRKTLDKFPRTWMIAFTKPKLCSLSVQSSTGRKPINSSRATSGDPGSGGASVAGRLHRPPSSELMGLCRLPA